MTGTEWREQGEALFDSDPKAALVAYQKAAKLDPDDPITWNQIGRLLFTLKNYDAAKKAFSRFSQLSEDEGNAQWHELGLQNIKLVEDTQNYEQELAVKEQKSVQSDHEKNTSAEEEVSKNSVEEETSPLEENTLDISDQKSTADDTPLEENKRESGADIPKHSGFDNTHSGNKKMSWWQVLFSFKGRIIRTQFWLGIAILLAIILPVMSAITTRVFSLVEANFQSGSGKNVFLQFRLMSMSVVLLLPILFIHSALLVKRLHDIGKSGWMVFFAYIWLLVSTVLIYFVFKLPVSVFIAQTLPAILFLLTILVGLVPGESYENRFSSAPVSNLASHIDQNVAMDDDHPVDYTMSWWRVLFSFYGRINQSQYWRAQILCIPLYILGLIYNQVIQSVPEPVSEYGRYIFAFIQVFTFLFFYPTYAVFAKRYHDRNMSGWHALWATLPIVYIVLLFHHGSEKSHPRRTVYDHHNPLPDGRPEHMFKGNFITRHWQGFLRVNESFWLNTVLLTWLIFVFMGLLPLLIGKYLSVGIAVSLSILISVFFVILAIWQVVGLWRSANIGMQAYPKKLGAIMARIAAVLLVLIWGNILYKRGLQDVEDVKIALGDGANGKRSFEILQNGKELFISGGVSFGLVDEVKRKLENNPDIEIIRLAGPGGRIGPARRLRKIIEQKKMTTYVTHECHSACTLIFLGGAKRVLHQKAKLGFHRFSASGMAAHEMKPEIDLERRYMAMKGIPVTFIEKVFATPASEIWTPSHDTLLNSGYVNRITNGDDFGSRPGKIAELAQLEKTILNDPAYKAMKKYEPRLYNDFWNSFRAGLLAGKSKIDLAETSLRARAKVEAETILTTSDKAVFELLKARLETQKFARDKSPVLCAKLLSPFEFGPLLNQHFPYEIMLTESQALANVIKDSHEAPTSRPDIGAVQKMMQLADRRGLRETDKAWLEMLSRTKANTALEFGPKCDYIIASKSYAIKMKPEEMGPAYRFIMAAEAATRASQTIKRPVREMKPSSVKLTTDQTTKIQPKRKPEGGFVSEPTIADYFDQKP